MGSFREETLSSIRNDYNAHGSRGRGSFLYQYLLHGKMKEKCAAVESQDEIDAIIHKAATDLMYNLGYPLSEKTVPKDRRRSHNTVLDLLDAWYAGRGEDMQFAAGGEIEEFDLRVYQELYDFLNTVGNTSVLIPVRVDAASGMGIYIVGRDHYMEFPYEDPKQTCGIGLLTGWFSEYESSPEERMDELRLALDEGTIEAPADYPNIEEANKWYTRLYGRDDARYGFFRECNGKVPDGLPERFRKYFEAEEGAGSKHTAEEDDIEHMTEQELEQTRKQFR